MWIESDGPLGHVPPWELCDLLQEVDGGRNVALRNKYHQQQQILSSRDPALLCISFLHTVAPMNQEPKRAHEISIRAPGMPSEPILKIWFVSAPSQLCKILRL